MEPELDEPPTRQPWEQPPPGGWGSHLGNVGSELALLMASIAVGVLGVRAMWMASELGRGGLLPVTGRVDADGEACQYARVDVSLRSKTGRLIAIGALPADAEGRFNGAVTVPFDVDVGDYDVVVSTPGDARCGPGQGE